MHGEFLRRTGHRAGLERSRGSLHGRESVFQGWKRQVGTACTAGSVLGVVVPGVFGGRDRTGAVGGGRPMVSSAEVGQLCSQMVT